MEPIQNSSDIRVTSLQVEGMTFFVSEQTKDNFLNWMLNNKAFSKDYECYSILSDVSAGVKTKTDITNYKTSKQQPAVHTAPTPTVKVTPDEIKKSNISLERPASFSESLQELRHKW